jgi:putative hydrolase of the HAD superfamily
MNDWVHDTVLLDMDGTLLDRHFDDHFWMEHVPGTYSLKRHSSRQGKGCTVFPFRKTP